MSGKNLNEENKELTQKLNGALRELDKVSKQLFDTQDVNKDLDEKLHERKHSEQLAGWAIDRALETLKLANDPGTNAEKVIDMAQKFCTWIIDSSIDGKVKDKKELN